VENEDGEAHAQIGAEWAEHTEQDAEAKNSQHGT